MYEDVPLRAQGSVNPEATRSFPAYKVMFGPMRRMFNLASEAIIDQLNPLVCMLAAEHPVLDGVPAAKFLYTLPAFKERRSRNT